VAAIAASAKQAAARQAALAGPAASEPGSPPSPPSLELGSPGGGETDGPAGELPDPDDHRDRGAETNASARPGRTEAATLARWRRSPLFLPAILGLLTVLLGGLAGWWGLQAHNLTDAPAARNRALTDGAATGQIIGQVTTAVNGIFSYDYANLARTRNAAQRALTGKAVQQYRGQFQGMQQDAARLKRLVLTTAVTNVGVETLTGHRARVLVFGSQVLTSASQAPQRFSVMVALDLVQQRGAWKIDAIDTYTGSP
jgi:Mce-associated membrane protein